MIIVTGLPRSGTSCLMQIFRDNGFEICIDNKRQPDENNPNGYLEIEKIGQKLKNNKNFLEELSGDVVKVISYFIDLVDENNSVICINRDIDEVTSSYSKLIKRKMKEKEINALIKHYENFMEKIKKRKNTIVINHLDLIQKKQSVITKINSILKNKKIKHLNSVNNTLYRNKKKLFL